MKGIRRGRKLAIKGEKRVFKLFGKLKKGVESRVLRKKGRDPSEGFLLLCFSLCGS